MGNLINKTVEPFSVQAFHAGALKTVSEADLKGHWSVFFFYPADFTFVCPTELEDLAENYEQFQKLNCEIYSVSTDSAFVHKAWADASPSIGKIRYPMPRRSASRSPAMERSITVSAPASSAALILRSSVLGQLHKGEVPMLALTLMRAGWPTRMGLRSWCAGLPSSTMPHCRRLARSSVPAPKTPTPQCNADSTF